MDTNYCRLPDWNVLRRCSTSAKVWLCELGPTLRHRSSNVDVSNAHSIYHTLGIPVSGGLALGFLAGFVRTTDTAI
ncbi:MAG: hypothetical protein WAJ93_16665 [Candidatus Nitrosopolaris sp.]